MDGARPPVAEVIAIGDELVSGQRLDTNSGWLSAELAVLGIPVVFHTTAADTLAAGREAFAAATARADIVVATGGLGPTADDLTRDVLAAVAGVPLERSAEAVMVIESRFARRGMPMPQSNLRQAEFPRGSRQIPNPHGTAPGIDLELAGGGRSSRVFALPGVPAEMRQMWRESVVPALLALRPQGGTIRQRRLKCFGAGESAIEALLPDLIRRGREPAVGITAHEATITLRIAAAGVDEAACDTSIAATEAVIRECLGDLVYGVEDDEIEDATLERLAARGLTLASAEVGTEGRVAAMLARAEARRSDAEPVFRGGLVIPPAGGAVTAAALAAEACQRFGAVCGVGVGPARPGPAGRQAVEIAVCGGLQAGTEHLLGGGPLLAAVRAAKTALDLVRRQALGRPVGAS